MSTASLRRAAYEAAMAEASRHAAAGDRVTAFSLLERAHVLGQRDLVLHLRVHLRMHALAWSLRDGREVRGQILRIAMTPFGHLTGRLPLGNTGGSNVSPFEPMAIPPELERLLSERNQ